MDTVEQMIKEAHMPGVTTGQQDVSSGLFGAKRKFPHSIGFSGRQMASDGEGSSTLDFLLIPDARSQDQP